MSTTAAVRALRIVIPVAIVALVVGLVWASNRSGGDSAGSDTTAPAETELEDVLKGIIVVGGLTGSREPTTVASTDSTLAQTTTTPDVATSPAPTLPAAPATAPPTVEASATAATPATTAAAATTTIAATAPPTTDEAPTTEGPPTTEGGTSELPTTAEFFEQWNSAAAGTSVPDISGSQATELTGDYAGYYLIALPPATGNRLPPQVGLVGTLTSPGSGQLAALSLVWIPGADEESSDFYWEAFDVLVQAISPGTTTDDTDALATSLGRAPGVPPFTSTDDASSGGFDYRVLTRSYDGPDGTVEVSAISVT